MKPLWTLLLCLGSVSPSIRAEHPAERTGRDVGHAIDRRRLAKTDTRAEREPEPERVSPNPGDRIDRPRLPALQGLDPEPGDPSKVTRPIDPATLWERRRGTAAGAAAWHTWWELNRAAHVNLRAFYHENFSVTPFGRGIRSGSRPRRPSHHAFVKHVHPMLAATEGTLRETALFTLARTSGAAEREASCAAVLKYVADTRRKNRDLMLFAVGVSREELGFDPLVDIALDSADGRKAYGSKSPLPVRVRAIAVFALGAMGDVDAVPELRGLLAGKERKHVDLGRACVASLGLLGGKLDAKARKSLADFLAAGMADKTWPREVRTGIPIALARLGRWMECADFLAAFREPREVRQSCALALGIAAPLSLDLVETLEASALRDTDALVRRFSALALGEVALRAPRRATSDDESVQRAARFFAGALKGQYKQPGDRPCQVLGAALFGRRFRFYADPLAERFVRMARSGVNEQRAAAALGLGLIDRPVGLTVLAKLTQAKDPVVRAYAAEARGLLRDRGARKELLALCREDKSMQVRYQAARGLAMLGDPSVIGPLVDAMAAERAQGAQAALTRVIGEIGDRDAIQSLKEVAADKRRGLWTRRHALAALGVLGQHDDHGWAFGFQRSANFAAATPTLRMVLAIF